MGARGLVFAAAAAFLFVHPALANQRDWDECTGKSAQNRADAYLFRANAHVVEGSFDQAIADYGEAIRLAPQNVVAYAGRAVAYFHKGDRDHAVID
jgi:Tfp pilus assembly protein PilF